MMSYWFGLFLAYFAAHNAAAFVTTAPRSNIDSYPAHGLHYRSQSCLLGIRERLFRWGTKKQFPKNISEAQVRDLFDQWNAALQSGDSNEVTKAYAQDAILIPTSSNQLKTNITAIKEYFDNVVKRNPSVRIIDGHITTGCNWAKNVGIYEWRFGDGSTKKARYTFVYVYQDEELKVGHHHSSSMPEG